MEKRTTFFIPSAILLSACSVTDSTGRELTSLEQSAVETCDRWLVTELRGTVGSINLSEGVVLIDEDSIDIAWQAQTPVGDGPILCSTDRLGMKVIEAQIDGLDIAL